MKQKKTLNELFRKKLGIKPTLGYLLRKRLGHDNTETKK